MRSRLEIQRLNINLAAANLLQRLRCHGERPNMLSKNGETPFKGGKQFLEA